MWSEGGTELFLEAFYIFLSQRVGLPGQFELLAVSPGQAEGGSIEANLSKHWPQHKMVRWSERKIYCCGCPEHKEFF